LARTRGQYRRSTPVGRLRKNVEKILKHAEILRTRLTSWGASGDASVLGALSEVTSKLLPCARLVDAHLERLVEVEFAPPASSSVYVPLIGDQVSVRPQYAAKYADLYEAYSKADPQFLVGAVVTKVVSNGIDVVVQKVGGPGPVVGKVRHFSRAERT